ncbi:heparinase II/III family protein [Arthrobacter sp. TMT4-20]
MVTTTQMSTLRGIVLELLPSTPGDVSTSRAMNFIENGLISSPSFGDVDYDQGAIWSAPLRRGQQRYLHGFIFFVDWFDTVLRNDETADQAALMAISLVKDWAERHPAPTSSQPMAHHDETTAQRLMNLISLEIRVRDIQPELSKQVLEPLISKTADLLAQDYFHASGNNHGMFQDLALLYWSILFASPHEARSESYFDTAMRRLKAYFSECFTNDGVHVENTPTYHLMVSRQVANVQRIAAIADHPDASYYASLISRAERYATHALMPDGVYPPISDTQQTAVSRSGIHKIFTTPEFAYASSVGARGRPPQERWLLLPNSGYAIYRSQWGDSDATFAFFSAAYNADYHKHSDDLSLFLRSKGIDLLSESGPYSYDYKDPFSRYAYSQFAHNSLVVDGVSLPRTDDKKDKVALRTVEEGPNGFTVVGTNARYENVIHQRTFAVTDGSGTPQFDLEDSISSTAEHDYELLWNLGTEVDVTLHGQGFELFHGGQKVMDLMFSADVPTSLSLREGVEKPKPMGWRFPKFGESTSAKVVIIRFSGKNAKLETKIRLDNFSYTDRNLSLAGWSRYESNVPLNFLFVPGKSELGRKKLTVVFTAIHNPGDFTYNYKATVDDVDISALYILDDFGDQGAYYHSDHRSSAIFETVQSLIKEVVQHNRLSVTDVVTAGSSKGGTAALIHGFALHAGRIIVGAPQTRIGTFVAGPHPNVLRFMAGGEGEDDIAHLDGIVDKYALEATDKTKVSILVGDNDHHLPRHVRPLLEGMSAENINPPNLTILADLSHADVGSVFRFFLRANLEQWVAGSPEESLPYILTADQGSRSIRIKVYAPAGVQLSYRLFKGSEIVRRRSYSDRRVVVFEDLPPGKYRVRVFQMATDPSLATAFTTRWLTIK